VILWFPETPRVVCAHPLQGFDDRPPSLFVRCHDASAHVRAARPTARVQDTSVFFITGPLLNCRRLTGIFRCRNSWKSSADGRSHAVRCSRKKVISGWRCARCQAYERGTWDPPLTAPYARSDPRRLCGCRLSWAEAAQTLVVLDGGFGCSVDNHVDRCGRIGIMTVFACSWHYSYARCEP